jgi:fructuronate reductase
VLGLAHVHDCVADARVGHFVRTFMSEDVGPQLARADWPAYRDALLERFANPSLCHRVHQICLDTSQKIPQRWVATALAALGVGHLPQHLAFAAAAWIRYLRGVDEQGCSYALDDPMAGSLQALARQYAGQPQQAVAALGTLTAIWGTELSANVPWLASMWHWLGRIEQVGLHSALDDLANGERPDLTLRG